MQQAFRKAPVTSLKLPGGGGFSGPESPTRTGGEGFGDFCVSPPPPLGLRLVVDQ